MLQKSHLKINWQTIKEEQAPVVKTEGRPVLQLHAHLCAAMVLGLWMLPSAFLCLSCWAKPRASVEQGTSLPAVSHRTSAVSRGGILEHRSHGTSSMNLFSLSSASLPLWGQLVPGDGRCHQAQGCSGAHVDQTGIY